MTNWRKISQPSIFGPGKWHDIHTFAKDSTTLEKKKNFVYKMNLIRDSLPCMECRNHCTDYIRNHPMEDYFYVQDESGKEIGLFQWSWQFHNAVNLRLKKPQMTWKEAMDLYYSDDGVCTSSCDEEKEDTTISSAQKQYDFININSGLLTNSSISNQGKSGRSYFRNA